MQTILQIPQRLFAQPVRYDVPAFQRRYVWEQEEQWEPLWGDVEQIADSIIHDGSAKSHFLGAVVLQQPQVPTGTIERRIVVDGQQRLTTLQLLIDAIQEVLEDRQYSAPAERLASLVENQEAFRGGNPDNAFKVWPTVVDRDAFRHAMTNDLSATGYAASRIVQAHEYFKRQAEQWLDRFSDDPRKSDHHAASALETAVRMNLELVVIDLSNTDDPHVIFETLNARGTPLLQSDMVKNKILHDAKIHVCDEEPVSSEQQRLWPFDKDDWWVKEVGRGFQSRPRIDLYLNHWLTLRNRREMKAYDEFRAFEKYVETLSKGGETIVKVAGDMNRIGSIYRDIEDVRRPDIAKFLERRNVMNVGAVTPLLLWLLSADVPKATLANCLQALESFLVRRMVCGHHARSYGTFFVSLIGKLDDASAENADRILVSLLADETAQATLWPSDEELRENFVGAPLYRQLTRGRLRMVLAGIEEQMRSDRAETPDAPSNLQIEHIMPQEWRANWPLPGDHEEDAAARRDRVLHAIGNLTLVTGRLNRELSNAAWEQKRDALDEHSVLYMNRHLIRKAGQVWNEAKIEKRAKRLHKRAVKVWPHRAGFDVT